MVCNEENAVEKWYAIREVSEITGVKPVTLRAWQRRYNLVQPERTEKGHRLYSEDNIEMIREIQGWLAKGIAIGKVKDLLVNPDEEGALAAESRELDEVERMLTALSVLNTGKAESVLNTVLKEYPFSVVCDQFLYPVMTTLERVKSTTRSLQKGLLRSMLHTRLTFIVEAERKAASKGKCLLLSYEGGDFIAGWVEAVTLSEQGWYVTLIDGVEDLSGLDFADVTEHYQRVHIFSHRALQEKQMNMVKSMLDNNKVTLSDVLARLQFG
ncbi:MerR family transcriptional regulator [Vibrio vulnificus]|nr:MerR family transcriptional regulator [Vibrio vulnificus]